MACNVVWMPGTRPHTPSLLLLRFGFLFSGAVTSLLGPMLPAFPHGWGLHDSGSGLLLGAQFLGLCTGSLALYSDLRKTLLLGYSLATAALLTLALCVLSIRGYLPGVAALFVLGIGLGQVSTSINLLAAKRYESPRERSAQLSLLNLMWSLGAIAAPAIAGAYLKYSGQFLLLLTFTAVGLIQLVGNGRTTTSRESGATGPAAQTSATTISPAMLCFYCLCFLLYGGVESSLGGWLSTYAMRYTSLHIAGAAYCSMALWAAIAAGRAGTPLVLRFLSERTIRLSGIALATAAVIALRLAHTALQVASCAAVAGLGIAPFVPITFSILISSRPSARQAGAATANIGLGAALFSLLTGALSSYAGSLQLALLMPIALGITLFGFCTRGMRNAPEEPRSSLPAPR